MKALAVGADAVMIGRPYLYGLATCGEAGVRRVLEILRTEMVRTLSLMGCPSVADLDRSWIELPGDAERSGLREPGQPHQDTGRAIVRAVEKRRQGRPVDVGRQPHPDTDEHGEQDEDDRQGDVAGIGTSSLGEPCRSESGQVHGIEPGRGPIGIGSRAQIRRIRPIRQGACSRWRSSRRSSWRR